MKIYDANITGSLQLNVEVSGSIYGTAIWPSASYAISSSYALNAGGSPGGSGVGDKIFLWQNFK